MSNTYKHKDKGKFHNKILKYEEVCDSTKNMWDRHNSDYGEDKERQLEIKEKIAEKEMKQQIKTDEYNFKNNGEFIEDIDDPYFKTKKLL